MTPLRELENKLRAGLPTARLDCADPAKPGGVGFLDIVLGGNTISVMWQEKKHFGVSSPEGHGYGEAADEVYETADDAATRIIDLLRSGRMTEPPLEVKLRELRVGRKMTQKDLAEALGVSQPAISMFERRIEGMKIATLKTVIRAMGGNLVLQAMFPDGAVRQIAIDKNETSDGLESAEELKRPLTSTQTRR